MPRGVVQEAFDTRDRPDGLGRRAARFRPGAPAWLAPTLLVVGSVLFSLMALELGCRLLRWGPEGLVHWPNLARERTGNRADGGGSCAYAFDDQLGWTSPPNCSSAGYNVDAAGFRRTPSASPLAEPPVLATGSSFTKGEEVADRQTWPFYLQEAIGRKVLNAGVSGYSFDQTVLGTERLAGGVKPRAIVVTFTPDDIRRTELKVSWSRQKPYFIPTERGLELANVPVPGRPRAPVPLPMAAGLLGWSALVDEVVARLGAQRGWYYEEVRAVPSGSGETIVCRLMPRLAAVGVPVLVVATYGRGHWLTDGESGAKAASVRKVLGCARQAGLMTLDLHDPLREAIQARGLDALYRSDHHSAEGNRVVADVIMRELARGRLLD